MPTRKQLPLPVERRQFAAGYRHPRGRESRICRRPSAQMARPVRRVDWEAVRLPDTATLMEFCQVLAVNAEYVLFGEGPPYRGQSRDKAELEADLAAELSRRLGERGHAVGKFLPIDARAVIAKAEEECAREVSALNEFDRAYDALAELGRALPHNPPSDSERATVRAREQLWSILIKLNGASPTHYVRPRTIYGIGEVSLPLLQVTGVGKVENP